VAAGIPTAPEQVGESNRKIPVDGSSEYAGKDIVMKSEIGAVPQRSPAARDTILVVEDVPANLDILMGLLSSEYFVSVALDGSSALESVASVNPDLILLDIMMPGMDGYEVCAKLKVNPATRDIPIIFLTALHEDVDEENGLRLGAVDYITKPYNPGIVKARVRNHLALRRTQVEVTRQRDQLEIAYRNLRELEKLRDGLVHMIVHDMRSPLTAMSLFLGQLSPELAQQPIFKKMLPSMQAVGEDLCGMVNSVLDVSRLESCQMPLHPEAIDLGCLTQTILERMGALTREHQVSFQLPTPPVIANCDRELTDRILQNLLGNALKFTPKGGCVQISLTADEKWAHLSITDTGPGIPAEYHQKVFEKFGQVETQKAGRIYSTGLGLTFCKLAVEAHKGSIQLESEPGRGTTFHVRLPLSGAA
jgi:signal transduction histidine kinase